MREDALLVLRLWRDAANADAWRASLTDLRTREVQHFADLRALKGHLNRRLRALSPQETDDDATDDALDGATDDAETT